MRNKRMRLWSIVIAVIMLMGMLSVTAMASENDVIEIDSNEDLVAAIAKQEDGQTWVFTKADTYDVYNASNFSNDKAGLSATNQKYGGYVPEEALITGHSGAEYIFPIYVDNLTIKKADGVGDVTITSAAQPSEANGGMGNYQNFLTITGNNVTIEGVNLKANTNDFYGTCNKILELYGSGLTLKDVNVIPLDNDDGTSFGGSIYFNASDVGNTKIENLSMDAWINANAVTDGSIAINGLVQDFSNSEYAGYHDDVNGYAWNPAVKGENVSVSDYTIAVGAGINLTEQVFNANLLRDGTTVRLTEDVEIDKMLEINADGITLDLNGNAITASDNFTYTYENDSHLVNVQGDDVAIKNGELVATDKNKNVLNLYGAENVTLKDVTLDHTDGFKGAPLVVNGSTVTVSGKLTTVTGSKSWYAINVGDNIDDNSAASLTFAENAQVAFEGAKSLGISVDAKKYAPATIAFRENVKVSSPDNFVVIYNPDGNNVIEDPENAGLVQNGGSYTENVTAENGIASINGKYYKTVEGAISAAKDGDTIQFASGEITLPDNLVITKRVSLAGAGKAETTLVGNIVYQFSSDQKNNTLKVSDLTLAAADSSLQGIQFRGNNANDGYNLNIVVENCAFDGWTYALAMNSHANKYHMTVKNCDFSNSLCAVNFNYDTTTSGQIADNSLKFEGQNVIAANGMAVETYGNSAAPGLAWYDTVANFEDNKPISGTVKFVHTSDELINAVDGASSETVIVLAPGTYEMSQLTFTNKNNITLQGAGMGKTILKDTDNGYLVNLSAGDCSNLKFKDMTLQGSGTTSALVKVADGTNCSGLSFENVEFTGATHGIYIGNDNSSQTSADNIQVNDCVFTDMTYAGIYAQRGNITVPGRW